MNWLNLLTRVVAGAAALECLTGRVAAMEWGRHRLPLMLAYLLASWVCIAAVSLIWQGKEAALLDWASWAVALHLVLTWRDWRNGAPPSALRGRPVYMQTDLMVSAPMIGRRERPLEPLDRGRE